MGGVKGAIRTPVGASEPGMCVRGVSRERGVGVWGVKGASEPGLAPKPGHFLLSTHKKHLREK